jgi:hypothetical protein
MPSGSACYATLSLFVSYFTGLFRIDMHWHETSQSFCYRLKFVFSLELWRLQIMPTRLGKEAGGVEGVMHSIARWRGHVISWLLSFSRHYEQS